MALEDTREITEIYGVGRAREVNNHLDLGWVLISTFVVYDGEPTGSTGIPHFILAWPRDAGTVPRRPENHHRIPKPI
jgi:hypothetical protein